MEETNLAHQHSQGSPHSKPGSFYPTFFLISNGESLEVTEFEFYSEANFFFNFLSFCF